MIKECPACGSNNIKIKITKDMVYTPYGPPVIYSIIDNSCCDCGEIGDFGEENESSIEAAIIKSKNESVGAMLYHLSSIGISDVYFERALRLPAQIVTEWKLGELSPASLALLRIIRTFPWILEIADKNFLLDDDYYDFIYMNNVMTEYFLMKLDKGDI